MARVTATLTIEFESEQQVQNVIQCLEVDEELQPTKITKQFECRGKQLLVHFTATEVKLLRVAMSSFFDMLIICTKTMLEFGN